MVLAASGAAAEEFGWGHRIGPIQSYYDIIISDENFTITHVDLDSVVAPVRTSQARAYFDAFVPAERASITRTYYDAFIPDETAGVTQEYYDEFVPRERTSSTQAYFDAFVSGRTNRGIYGII